MWHMAWILTLRRKISEFKTNLAYRFPRLNQRNQGRPGERGEERRERREDRQTDRLRVREGGQALTFYLKLAWSSLGNTN